MVHGEGVGVSPVLTIPATHVPHAWTRVLGLAVGHVLQASQGMAPGKVAAQLAARTVPASLECPARMWLAVGSAVGPVLMGMLVMAPGLDAVGLVSR